MVRVVLWVVVMALVLGKHLWVVIDLLMVGLAVMVQQLRMM
jgi:hypothetical protein